MGNDLKKEDRIMDKNVRIVLVIIAVVFGILLGLSESENKRYSYKA